VVSPMVASPSVDQCPSRRRKSTEKLTGKRCVQRVREYRLRTQLYYGFIAGLGRYLRYSLVSSKARHADLLGLRSTQQPNLRALDADGVH
jgi:hypothetical protein